MMHLSFGIFMLWGIFMILVAWIYPCDMGTSMAITVVFLVAMRLVVREYRKALKNDKL